MNVFMTLAMGSGDGMFLICSRFAKSQLESAGKDRMAAEWDASGDPVGCGVVFELSPGGTLTVLPSPAAATGFTPGISTGRQSMAAVRGKNGTVFDLTGRLRPGGPCLA
jgi:hypothetical protein